jgi:tricorn protease interacting factor F2/3
MTDIAPMLYRLRLTPDLERFTFEGRVEIHLCAAQPAAEIVLNAVDLAVWGCRLLAGTAPAVPCRFRVDPAREELAVLLPQPASGQLVVAVDYTGRINDRMAGFYRSRSTHGGEAHVIAVTQFQESDARRAFPCMDHPGRKAAFEIELEVDRRLTAVSNTAIRAQELLENGRKRVIFERTPVMSTYLVFFGVGEFEVLQDPLDPRVRALTLPGQQKHAGFGLEFGRIALQHSEAYFGIPYPLAKMDLIAIPDFAFGAMENWGAITFRENLLLHHPETTSKAGEERICEVIAHEIAHQWFGNLVTPADWKYLWLNESFATYFGYGVVAHHHPEWEIWPQFLAGTAAAAMARDGLKENVAIEIPGGEHLVINTSTAPIIYSKGASILRQVEGYIGAENFQAGLRRYLGAHAYGCAESRHLWEAFEAVSEKPVVALMQSWIGQPGFPLVTVRREPGALVLSQRRFSYLESDADQHWLIPINLALYDGAGRLRRLSVVFEGRQMRVPVDGEPVACKLNAGQTGFYRVAYADPADLAALGRLVREKTLPPEDRWGLQDDLYARVLSGAVALEEYLDFLKFYQSEDAYLPLTSIAQHLGHAHLVVAPQRRRAIAALAGPWFEGVLGRIGFAPRPGEPQTAAILREQLLADALQYGVVTAENFLLKQFEGLRRGAAVPADILRAVLQAAAWCGGAEAFAWLERRFRESVSEHERLIILAAMGMFRSPPEIARALDFVLAAVPARNQFMPLVAMASNPHAQALLWEWYAARVAEIEQFHPMLYERVVAAIVPACGLGRGDEVRAFFQDYGRRTDRAREVIRLSLERLEIHERLRRASLT